MTYADVCAALFAARRFGVKLGLEPMREALNRLGNPERRMGATIHIAGTNGKGSTAAFTAAALHAGGHRVGLYTSPHLCRFTERIRIDGAETDPDALAARYAEARAVLEPLTFFEQATLLALLTFAAEKTDVVVLEVGLGGRLDATNVVEAEVGVVTGVSLDHMDVLGADLDAIAGEKAGIFKAGKEAVLGACGEPRGRLRLHELALAAGVRDVTLGGSQVPASWILGLRGAHQSKNAACALAALDALDRATRGRIRVPVDKRREAFAAVRWPGRLEEVADDPRVWLDGAHNPQGAEALAAALRAERPTRVAAVVGISTDKDARGVLAPIVSQAELVVCTQARNDRAMPAAHLAAIAAGLPGPPGRQILAEPDLRRALGLAGGATHRASDLTIVYGSLFVVGAARALLTGESLDPTPLSDPAAKSTGLH